MKKWLCIPLCILFAFMFYCTSKVNSSEPENKTFELYFASDNLTFGSALAPEKHALSSGQDKTNRLIRLLLLGPESPDLLPIFPKGTTLLSKTLEDHVLTLNFSKEYGDLTGAELTLANGAVVLTMTQLEPVDHVIILSAGEPVRPASTTQPLSAEDFDLSSMSADPIHLKIPLVFLSADGNDIVTEIRSLQLSASHQTSRIQAVLTALCGGPERKDAAAYLPPSSDGVTVRVKNDTCLLTLDREWMQALIDKEGNATLAAWALTASITALDGINQVSYWDGNAEISSLSAQSITALQHSNEKSTGFQ